VTSVVVSDQLGLYVYLDLFGLGVNYISTYKMVILYGMIDTIIIAILSFSVALLVGVISALTNHLRYFRCVSYWPVFYTAFIRGMPDIVWVLLVYFLGQAFIGIFSAHIWLSPYIYGWVALGILYGGYVCEIIHEALSKLDSSQVRDSISLGLTPWQALITVTCPQIIGRALPGINNVWQNIIKSTAVLSVIGVDNLVHSSDVAGKSSGHIFIFIFITMAIFLIITIISELIFNYLENISWFGGGAHGSIYSGN